MVGRVFSDGTIQLSIAADTADYNVHTAAGSPASKADVVVTIASGVQVYQNAGNAALRTGTFASGSKIRVINRGYIVGKGGNGGAGGASSSNGSAGSAGGPAVWCEAQTLEIDNSAGYILGGGGGGGGGGGNYLGDGGNGGGGGRGRGSSSGGSGGAPNGESGDPGSFAGAGAGGDGSLAGDGGFGGDWATAGETGSTSVIGGYTGGAGGAPGKAVYRTGGTLVWLGGYNSAQVQGAVD
jgi:hypothetical protein